MKQNHFNSLPGCVLKLKAEAVALFLIFFHSKSGIAIATMFRDLWGRGWVVIIFFKSNWHVLYCEFSKALCKVQYKLV